MYCKLRFKKIEFYRKEKERFIMNAKIKLSLLALASVSMLASCGAKGETLTRAQAETELNSYVGKAATPTKFTYAKKTVAKKSGINVSCSFSF